MNDVARRSPKTDWEIAQEARLLPIREVAAKLGIPHQTLASKIESLGIDKRQFKVQPSKQASA